MDEEQLEDFEDAREIIRQKQLQRATKVPMTEWKPGRGLEPPAEKKGDDLQG